MKRIVCFLFCVGIVWGQSSDRKYWSDLAYRIAAPVLKSMSEGKLQATMSVEVSPIWDGRNSKVAYMEAFGRLVAGISPWLSLPDDNSAESRQRAQLREWLLKSYANAVDPKHPDFLLWEVEPQRLVDASYIAESFLRAPSLWKSLDRLTQQRYIDCFKKTRDIQPAYNNWLLFRGMIEAFLASIDQDYDLFTLSLVVNKVNEWYLGDGWYSDGKEFSLDYYQSYVFHPMIVEILEVAKQKNLHFSLGFDLALERMQRYNVQLERMISPEATFPVVGRSATYRMGAFQSLSLAAWRYGLPVSLTRGQVRNALTSVMKRLFSASEIFDENGFLTLGFWGYQPYLADYYSNTGSMYITALAFLPLGLPADDAFWTDPPEQWTAQRAWAGRPIEKDYHQSLVR